MIPYHSIYPLHRPSGSQSIIMVSFLITLNFCNHLPSSSSTSLWKSFILFQNSTKDFNHSYPQLSTSLWIKHLQVKIQIIIVTSLTHVISQNTFNTCSDGSGRLYIPKYFLKTMEKWFIKTVLLHWLHFSFFCL